MPIYECEFCIIQFELNPSKTFMFELENPKCPRCGKSGDVTILEDIKK